LNILDKIVEIIRECVRMSHNVEDPSERSRLLRKLASYLDRIGLREEARELLLDAARVSLNIQDPHERVLELVYIANNLKRIGYIESAFEILDKGIESLEAEEDQEAVLAGLLHIIDELINMKALDRAQEVLSMILSTIDRLETKELSDAEMLLDTLEYVILLGDEKTKKDIFYRVLERVEEIEDEDIRRRIYEELLFIALYQNWFDVAKRIITERVETLQDKVDLLEKLIEYYEERISRIGVIYEETLEEE